VKRRADTGKWEVRWRESGRNRSKSFTLKSDARRFEADVHRARELGRPLDIDRGAETLAAFVGVYWRRYAVPHLADKTRMDYRGAWVKHVLPRIGGYRLRDVTPSVVDEFRAELIADGVGEAMVAKVLTVLSSMFRCGVTWDRIDRNPLREIRIPQAKRKRLVRPLAPERVEAIRAVLRSEGGLRHATLVAVLAYAGLRPQEARALRWGDIGERTLRVERAAAGSSVKATKTETLRTVRLLAPVVEDIEAWRRESAAEGGDASLVFPTVRGTLMSDNDWRNWRTRIYRPAAATAGLANSPPYDLRHSFASLLINEGASVVEVARQMGNAPSVTLDTYGHVFDEDELGSRFDPVEAIEAARAEFDVREMFAGMRSTSPTESVDPAPEDEALFRTRTGDPLLTMEVLYQLS
jgi:integrase